MKNINVNIHFFKSSLLFLIFFFNNYVHITNVDVNWSLDNDSEKIFNIIW